MTRQKLLSAIETLPREDGLHLVHDCHDEGKQHTLRWRILKNMYRRHGFSVPTDGDCYTAQVESITGLAILCGTKTRSAMLTAYDYMEGHIDTDFASKFTVFAGTPEEIVDIIEEVTEASL